MLAAFADLPYGNKAASAKRGFCIRIRQVRELLYRLPRWGSWRVAPDEGLRKAKHRTMLCRLPACPHPSPFGDTFPKGEGLDVVPPVSRRMAPFYLCLPCVKGVWYGTRCVPNEFPLRETSRAPEGLLHSHGTTPQSTSSGCFSVSLAKSSVFSRRRKTPRDALRLVQLTPCTGEPKMIFPAHQQKFLRVCVFS